MLFTWHTGKCCCNWLIGDIIPDCFECFVWVKLSLHTSQEAHQAGAYLGFPSMKRLGVFLLHPEWDASPSYPIPIYTHAWREALWEYNVFSKNTTQCWARTRIAWSRDEHINHEATGPPSECFVYKSLTPNHKQQLTISLFALNKSGKDGTDPKEKDWDAEMTRVKEKEWFEKHPQYYDIQHVCGIDRLMDTMISLLADKMVTEVPNLVREMKNLKKQVNKLCAMSFLLLLLYFLSKYCTQESSLLLSRELFSPCLA